MSILITVGTRCRKLRQGGFLQDVLQKYNDYENRVVTDGGEVQGSDVTKMILRHLKLNKTYDDTKLLFTPEGGMKTRTSGVNTYATKGYDLGAADGENQDLVQTTESAQPHVCGNIAPNERLGLKNSVYGSSYFSHPDIIFDGSTSGVITFVVNFDTNGKLIGGWRFIVGSSNTNCIAYHSGDNGLWYYNTELGHSVTLLPHSTMKQYFGKNAIISLSIEPSQIDIYLNGKFVRTSSTALNLKLNKFFGSGNNWYSVWGTLPYYRIQQGAMTPEQIEAEHTFLRTLYPEIPNVKIGDQHWATSNFEPVTTPMGNTMQEITDVAAVEKMVNGGFDSDTIWVKQGNVLISGGVCSFSGVDALTYVYQKLGTGIRNKWVKIQYTVSNYTSGSIYFYVWGSTQSQAGIERNANGNYTEYLKVTDLATGSCGLRCPAGGGVLDVDNFSVKELGWADSGELYTYLTTEGGYSEQDALKECAWWCYYNNDPAVGAVYGKLYNWYAAKLLQNDIDAHNAANPTATWGWHVPTRSEFETLADTLGGSAVAGGKMKVTGTEHWNSPNAGADNSSGFSVIGSGVRDGASGMFAELNYRSRLVISDDSTNMIIRQDTSSVSIGGIIKKTGTVIRLLKDN